MKSRSFSPEISKIKIKEELSYINASYSGRISENKKRLLNRLIEVT